MVSLVLVDDGGDVRRFRRRVHPKNEESARVECLPFAVSRRDEACVLHLWMHAYGGGSP